MKDQRSVEVLRFSFASRTIAYKRLEQDLAHRSLSAFSSFIRKYLDQVIKLKQINVQSLETTSQ